MVECIANFPAAVLALQTLQFESYVKLPFALQTLQFESYVKLPFA